MIGILPIVLVLVVVGIVVAVTSGRRSSGLSPDQHGVAGGVRRVFWYAVLAVGVGLAASGVAALISIVIPGGVVVGDGESQLASALSSTLVGLPLAVVMVRSTRRRVSTEPAERRSTAWSTYVAGMSVVAAGFTIAGLATVVSWAIGGGSTPADMIGTTITWAAVWWLHRWTAHSPDLSPLSGPNAAVAWESTISLAAAAGGGGVLLATLLGDAYSRITEEITIGGARSALAAPAGWLIAGGLAWAMTWLRDGARRQPTMGLQTYELSVGVLGGLVATIVSIATAVFAAVEWVAGEPETTSAATQFSVLPTALATALVGSLVWWHHRRSVGASEIGSAAERAYRYLAAAIGLGAAAVGGGTLVAAFFASFGTALAGGSTVDFVLGGLTTLLVGAPFWWVNWRFVERAVADDPTGERASGARRVFLTAVLGVTGTAAVGSGVAALTAVIRGILATDRIGMILESLSVPMGILVAAGAVAGTHGRIWRSERSVVVRRGPQIVTVIGPDVAELADSIRASGAHVVVLTQSGELPAPGTDPIEALATMTAPEAVVVVDGDRTVVLPVERG